jgi:hypothetical protein
MTRVPWWVWVLLVVGAIWGAGIAQYMVTK